MSKPIKAGAQHYPQQARGMNNFIHDRNLRRYLHRLYPDMLRRQSATLESLGAFCGGRLDAQAAYSDRIAPPKLVQDLDRVTAPGKRTGRVVANEDYKDCQQELYRHGVIAKCFDPQAPEPHMLAFTAQYMASYTDISTGCPLAMTHPNALALATRAPKEVREAFLPQYLRTDGKTMVGGTWATEWAGGSDVKGNTETRAHLTGPTQCIVNGRNFFTSAMGFDSWGAIKTVKMDRGQGEGIALVFVTRFTDRDWDTPEHTRKENSVHVTHLKEKSGTTGLPTAEIELRNATGHLIADEKNGLRAMMEALGCSRVHNAMAAAGVMHRAYVEAMCWTAHRRTFGDTLDTRPDIQEDLLQLKTAWLGGAALAFEAARSFDDALKDPVHKPWLRVATALAKYMTAEQATTCTAKVTELVGGIGYTRDHPIERIHRDAMVLRVWEGPKNIQAKDLMFMLGRQGGMDAFDARLRTISAALPVCMSNEKASLRQVYSNLQTGLQDVVKAQDPAIREAAGPRVLHEMAKVLTYALLCEEAGHELTQNNDVNKLLTARYFQEQHFGTPSADLAKKHGLQAHFTATAQGLPVRPDDLETGDPVKGCGAHFKR